jgi:hypothetical protein
MSQIQASPLLRGFKGNSGTQNDREQRWLVTGTDDEYQAQAAALAQCDELAYTLYGGLIPVNVVGFEQTASEMYIVTIHWGIDQNQNNKDPTFQFDLGGGSFKATQSLATVGMYKASSNTDAIPDYQGAIGVRGPDEVEGVEVPVQAYNWSEKHFLPSAIVTPQFRDNLELLKTGTNMAAFRGKQPAQVQFQNLKGAKIGHDTWELNFDFSSGPILQNYVIRSPLGNITVTTKNPWDYLWIKYATKVVAGVPIPAAQYVYVEQVFNPVDFSQLGIPQGPGEGGA